MVDFAEIADVIADVIVDEGLGATITFTSITPGAYNPATGAVTTTTADETVSAIIEDYRGLALISGLAQAGDKKVSIPAASLTATPKPTDKVTVGGLTYAVISVNTVQGGDTAILRVLQCRRA